MFNAHPCPSTINETFVSFSFEVEKVSNSKIFKLNFCEKFKPDEKSIISFQNGFQLSSAFCWRCKTSEIHLFSLPLGILAG